MSNSELQRVELVALRRAGKISQAEVARRLGLSERQVRRLEAQVAEFGAAGLRSRKRGCPSHRKTADSILTQAMAIIRSQYPDFGPTLAAEYLASQHQIGLSKETVRKAMIASKLWRPKRGPKARIHALRQRRPRFGELIQVDGSFHDWFEGRAERCSLIVFIDDATSQLTQLRFVDYECTLAYMDALFGHLTTYGLPMALYSDRHGIFVSNQGKNTGEASLQFGRALDVLGIESICANSPQAKGRVERVNRTLQNRLVKAMRIEGISSIAAANAWLPGFVIKHNARFAVLPQDPADAHAPCATSPEALRQILARHYPRVLSNNLSCQFQGHTLQICIDSGGLGMRGVKVTVVEHFDHSVEVLWRTRSLNFTVAPAKQPQLRTVDRKQVDCPRPRKPSSHKPPENHPFRRWNPIPPKTIEERVRFER